MIEIVDPTRLRDSLQCLRYYYWRHERGYTLNKPKMALAYGSAVHACLAAHYEGKTAGQALVEFEKVWDREVTPYQTDMEEEDKKRNPVRWLEQFMLYREHYAVEPFTVLTLPNDRPGIEVPFFLPLTDDLALGGIIDLLVFYLNQIMVIDHKTTSYLNSKWTASFNPNHQFTAYLLAANELLKPEQSIKTLLVNAILVHATENRPDKMFDRIPTVRSTWQLNAFKEMMIDWWDGVVRPNRRTGAWPQNDDRCERWPGGCEYKDLCTEIQANHRKLVPSPAIYRQQIWDPIQDLRDHGLEVTI